jgi:phenylacetate-CoA ligase
MGPGVSAECVEGRDGAHVNEDHFLVEVVDPETGQPLPDGAVGELVFTTLTKEALPLLRYRTGDLASLTREPCACGRTFARMSRVLGRTDDMLIIRGVNVFPSEVERALLAIPELAPHYQLVVERPGHLDELTVQVEGKAEATSVRKQLHSVLGLTAQVEIVEPGSIPRSEGKALRVLDRRGT